jgi:hypothetical protein
VAGRQPAVAAPTIPRMVTGEGVAGSDENFVNRRDMLYTLR